MLHSSHLKKPAIILIGLAALVLLFLLWRTAMTPLAPVAYETKEECERATQQECGFVMCDYIPPGKTLEQVCGRGYRPGWRPRQERAASEGTSAESGEERVK